MTIVLLFAAALLLAIERLTYAWVWKNPEQFESLCRRYERGVEPVDALKYLFWVFKVIQLGVFVGWCLWWGGRRLEWPGAAPLAAALALLAVGQFLNVAVFHRLGPVGVFYGARFGRAVAWCTAFPFSLMRHPQYVGTVLSIWGFFLLLRYPQPDWMVLPLLETAYYALGARFERDGMGNESDELEHGPQAARPRRRAGRAAAVRGADGIEARRVSGNGEALDVNHARQRL